MNSERLLALSISDISDHLRNRAVSSEELVSSLLERINRINPKTNAYVSVFHGSALRAAKVADEEIRAGNYRGPLHGIPIAVKDIIAVDGTVNSAGSRILSNNVTTYDATVVERLKDSGAVIVGKNNLHEFAYGPTGEESYYGPCRNPWNTSMIAGGSSGGFSCGRCGVAMLWFDWN